MDKVSGYPNGLFYFKPGDTVRCLRDIQFLDQSTHKEGEILQITEKTEAYFNVCQYDYEKVS